MSVNCVQRTKRVAIPVPLCFAALAALVVLRAHGHKVVPIVKQSRIILGVNQVVDDGTGVLALDAGIA